VSVPTQVIIASIIHDPINNNYARAMSKSRMALFQERENDEPMALQVNILGDLSANNTKYPSTGTKGPAGLFISCFGSNRD
jgi:hypothetical protein